jgi:hypothetical protein
MRKVMLVMVGCIAATVVGVAWSQDQPAPAATVLFDFEDEADVKKWDAKNSEPSASTEHATSGKGSMKLTLKGGVDFPGIYTERFPTKDWSGFKTLKFDVFADEPMTLMLSIKDPDSKDYASRFNMDKIEINKGANTVVIPLSDVGAKIDVKKIKSTTIFSGKLDKDTTIYLDNVRLEK